MAVDEQKSIIHDQMIQFLAPFSAFLDGLLLALALFNSYNSSPMPDWAYEVLNMSFNITSYMYMILADLI